MAQSRRKRRKLGLVRLAPEPYAPGAEVPEGAFVPEGALSMAHDLARDTGVMPRFTVPRPGVFRVEHYCEHVYAYAEYRRAVGSTTWKHTRAYREVKGVRVNAWDTYDEYVHLFNKHNGDPEYMPPKVDPLTVDPREPDEVPDEYVKEIYARFVAAYVESDNGARHIAEIGTSRDPETDELVYVAGIRSTTNRVFIQIGVVADDSTRYFVIASDGDGFSMNGVFKGDVKALTETLLGSGMDMPNRTPAQEQRKPVERGVQGRGANSVLVRKATVIRN